jgi:hypothetical protein
VHAGIGTGSQLHWAATAYNARQTKGGVLLVKQIVVSGADGPVIEHLWSNFFIGGKIDEEFGPAPADRTFPGDARSKLAASRTVGVQRDQTFRYAGVSGDHVGHAIDDEMARAEGRPGKILQGMCTFGLASGAVVDLVAGGDPDRLARLAVRFAAPA